MVQVEVVVLVQMRQTGQVVLGLREETRLKWLDAILVTTGVWTAILLLQFIFMLYFNEVQG